ncbi:Cytidylate kinase [Commensalibacter sp. Nvir]|uniref:(d)CMP kinase n=1 Tax=Commensalibacter sp. Nvir TaxID=3069817 RepID=UPI002D65A6E5|nr:Cytidylate kinase [Commensalibacter sp. Nvir]
MKPPLTIAIDGPSGVGKGTLAKALAERLALPYLDTGLLYRAIARKMLDLKLDSKDKRLISIAEDLSPEDWNRNDLRSPEVDFASSQIATNPLIRNALLNRQRSFAKAKGGVLDGRDIGTVVLPQAQVKLYVTASPNVRAERRWSQNAKEEDMSKKEQRLKEIKKALLERDRVDETRAVAPLKPAEDAFILNTDFLTIDEVVALSLKYIFQKMNTT